MTSSLSSKIMAGKAAEVHGSVNILGNSVKSTAVMMYYTIPYVRFHSGNDVGGHLCI